MLAVTSTGNNRNHIVLRENRQGYRGVPGQNSRSASSPSVHPFPFWFDPVCPGITPILPKTVKSPSGRGITEFLVVQGRNVILYVFGFTRNNAG